MLLEYRLYEKQINMEDIVIGMAIMYSNLEKK